MTGRTIAHYRIVEKLGEGGMGVVYKALDTHLDRFIALKVLPAGKVADPGRKARFIQEAKAASALNHPNIVTVHDVSEAEGVSFIAMEYVEGKTIDQLMARKGMRLSETLKAGVQIADALARAHAAGIIHRDLKPSNVMVDEHGLVKVLDFGLAKLTEAETAEEAPTETLKPRTEEGTIVGTAGYMSPEQVEGKKIDARSDIFSFGAMLYEMVTGHRAFKGDSKVATLSAVLHQEPAPPPPETPPDLAKLIARCLRKDAAKRFQHMDDVRVALEELKEESDSGRLTAPASLRPKTPGRPTMAVIAAALTIAVLAAAWVIRKAFSAREPDTAFREIPFTAEPGFEMYPSFSPDGLAVAYQKMPPSEDWGPGSPPVSVMVKMVGTESTATLKDSAGSPVWSPDGRWIAFTRRANWFSSNSSLLLMPRIGGTERKIADVSQGAWGAYATWTPDSKWLVAVDRDRPGVPFHLVLVSADTGDKQRLTSPPPFLAGDNSPAISPDGRTLAFCRRTSGPAGDLYLQDLDANYRPSGQPRKLNTGLPVSNWPVWTRDGKEIIFCSGLWSFATLWRIRADGSGLARRLPFGGVGAFQPNLAPTGDRLVYIKQAWDTDIWRIELLPSGLPAGAPQKFIASNRAEYGAAWSPDGRYIAFASQRAGPTQIWICDSNGAGQRQLTSMESNLGMEPVWSPDGEWIAFSADTAGNQDIYVVPLRGGSPRRLTNDPASDHSPRWSPDGKFVYFYSSRSGQERLWKVPREGGSATLEPARLPEVPDPGGNGGYSALAEGGLLSIWREPAGAASAERLTERIAERPFAATAKGIYYVPRGPESNPSYTALTFFEFATGKSIKIADLKPHLGLWWGTRPSVSPDGRYLLYTRYGVETNDLMLVENFR